jgi:hypothetical protein
MNRLGTHSWATRRTPNIHLRGSPTRYTLFLAQSNSRSLAGFLRPKRKALDAMVVFEAEDPTHELHSFLNGLDSASGRLAAPGDRQIFDSLVSHRENLQPVRPKSIYGCAKG